MTGVMIISILALVMSTLTFVTVLVLLGRRDFQYVSKEDLAELASRVEHLGTGLSRTWHYVEVVDDAALGKRGHGLLLSRLYRLKATAGD